MDIEANEKSRPPTDTDEMEGDVPSGPNDSALEDKEAGEVYETWFTKDGIRLHPQPTADPLDPLNWSSWRKHSILGIVMWM